MKMETQKVIAFQAVKYHIGEAKKLVDCGIGCLRYEIGIASRISIHERLGLRELESLDLEEDRSKIAAVLDSTLKTSIKKGRLHC